MNYNLPPPPLPTKPFYNFDWMLSQFLAQRIQPSSLAQTNTIRPAPSIKENLCDVYIQIQSLRTEYERLRSNDIGKIPPLDWQHSIDGIQQQCNAVQTSVAAITPLAASRRRRRSKRKRHAAITREKYLQFHTEQLRHRAQLHRRIDEWQRNRIEQLAVSKQAELDAERVALILANVTKRTAEAQRHLDTLGELINLRRVRRAQAIGRSSEESASDRAFVEAIDRLRAVWRDALANYEREADELRRCVEPNVGAKVETWQRVLFGAGSRDLVKRSEATTIASVRLVFAVFVYLY